MNLRNLNWVDEVGSDPHASQLKKNGPWATKRHLIIDVGPTNVNFFVVSAAKVERKTSQNGGYFADQVNQSILTA